MTRPTSRRAFSLIEVLATIAILAAVALISMGLLRSTLNMSQAMADAHTIRSQYDNAMKQLRRDVWRSTSIRVSEPGQVVLQARDGAITWAYDPQARCLTRAVGPGVGSALATWRDLPRTVRFEATPGGVRIRWEDAKSAVVVDLASQPLLAGGQP